MLRPTLWGFALCSMLVTFGGRTSLAQSEPIPLLIGGYGPGLYRAELNVGDGVLSEPQLLATVDRASFFAQHPSLDVWYSVSEASSHDGNGSSPVVIAFQADNKLSNLHEINRQGVGGEGPCYVSVDPRGQFVFVANYGDGSICMLPIDEQGKLQPASQAIQHSGSSVNPNRQREPHAHCAVVDPSGTYVLFADLGIDKVMIYSIDRDSQQMVPQENHLVMPPGAGPRHVAFHPSKPWLYVINELKSTICVADWDANSGTATIKQEISTLPEGFSEGNSTAEILVHPSGRFVYGSNRGHDSLASFTVNDADGTITASGHCPTGGTTPRNFRIDPSGKIVLAENQNSDSIFVLTVNNETGVLSNTGKSVAVPAPACIKFARQ